jgi:hypothetical protein
MSSESPKPPETVSLPKDLLVEFEEGFSRLWLMVSNIAAQIENGTDARQNLPLLRQELNLALNTLADWRWAKWTRESDRPAA